MTSQLERTRLSLQDRLDSLKSQEQRNILGQFATPSQLAEDILRYAHKEIGNDAEVRFLDPAIGTGAFYSALLRVFQDVQIKHAQGFEIDGHYGVPSMDLWKSSALDFRLADFTAVPSPEEEYRPNLIICNPPYVRHHHLDGITKTHLAEAAARSAGIALGGLSGLYCYFMAIAHAWLSEGGLSGWLIPSEFMDVNYGSGIRRYLTEAVELIHIHRFDPTDLQFGDAQVSSSVVWFRKRKPVSSNVVQMSFGGSLSHPLLRRQVSMDELRSSSKWSGLVRGVVRVKSQAAVLSDLFSIKRGLATGDNKFFVVSEERAVALSIPQKFLIPVLPSPRHLPDNIVEADESGRPVLDKRLYLLDCSLPESEILRLAPTLAAYLDSGREKAAQTYICSRRTPWYSQEKRPAAPFVCTYMGRGLRGKEKPFRFILNKSNATALNVYLMLYPKPFLAGALREYPRLSIAIWRILNEIPTEILLDEGRVYGGGLYKMEPKELARVPADGIMALLAASGTGRMVQSEMFGGLVA
jgi:adenine-specific DNA-methyltransferase